MSSADSAHPADDSCPAGTVIRFDRHSLRTARSRRTPHHPAPEPVAATPHQRLATTMEALFLNEGHTLCDETTVEVYRTTLDAVQLMLDGSLAEGLVGAAEHTHLSGMVDGMRAAPDEL